MECDARTRPTHAEGFCRRACDGRDARSGRRRRVRRALRPSAAAVASWRPVHHHCIVAPGRARAGHSPGGARGGGFAARYAHLPLPWLLGALFTTTALSLAGAPVRLIPWGRPAGTVVVGASTGLRVPAARCANV